jgi:hypothetical protein
MFGKRKTCAVWLIVPLNGLAGSMWRSINAGTDGQQALLTEHSPVTYAATFDTNVLGTILSLKHELRVMIAQGSGSIIKSSNNWFRRSGVASSMSQGRNG